MKKKLTARPSQVSCVFGPPLEFSHLSSERRSILAERAEHRAKSGFLHKK